MITTVEVILIISVFAAVGIILLMLRRGLK